MTAAASVLSRYPEDVSRAVTDPRSGIAGKIKWFPTIYEIREACDAENARLRGIEAREASLKAQFAERERMAAMDPAEKRRQFIKREMALLNVSLDQFEPDRPTPPIDIRKMEECADKDRLRKTLDAELARISRNAAASDLRLSPAALRAIGIQPTIDLSEDVA